MTEFLAPTRRSLLLLLGAPPLAWRSDERASEVEQIGGRLSRRAERPAKLRQLLLVQPALGLRRGERSRQRARLVQPLGLTQISQAEFEGGAPPFLLSGTGRTGIKFAVANLVLCI